MGLMHNSTPNIPFKR